MFGGGAGCFFFVLFVSVELRKGVELLLEERGKSSSLRSLQRWPLVLQLSRFFGRARVLGADIIWGLAFKKNRIVVANRLPEIGGCVFLCWDDQKGGTIRCLFRRALLRGLVSREGKSNAIMLAVPSDFETNTVQVGCLKDQLSFAS